jgi:predicted ATPase
VRPRADGHGATGGAAAEANPALRVLVTAQARLGVPWENVLALQPLSSSKEAERLFFSRSRLDGGEAAMSPDDRSSVEPLYKELHGNAAALEIAAAQVRSAGVQRTADARKRGGAGQDADVLRLAVLSSLQDVPDAEAALLRGSPRCRTGHVTAGALRAQVQRTVALSCEHGHAPAQVLHALQEQ